MSRDLSQGRQAAWRPEAPWIGGVSWADGVASFPVAGADEEEVASFDFDVEGFFGGVEVFGEDGFGFVHVVDTLEGGEVEEDGTGDYTVPEEVDALHSSSATGSNGFCGVAVVHLVAVEPVGEGVDVGHDVAVEDEADVFAGAVGGEFGLAGGGVPALAAFNHVEGGRNGAVVGGLGNYGAAHGDADAFLRRVATAWRRFSRGYEVDCAELVVGSPAAPVAEGGVVFANLCRGGKCPGHGSSLCGEDGVGL